MQQTKTRTTIHLALPDVRKAWYLPAPVSLTICIFAVAGIIAAVGRIERTPAPAVQPTAALLPQPVIVIQRMPTAAAVPQPTPDPRIAELERRIAELEQQQQAPQVVVQPVYVPQPGPAYVEQPYQVTNSSEPPPAASPEPEAQPAVAPAPAQQAQPQPTSTGHTVQFTPPSDVERKWAIEAWKQEHCLNIGTSAETCVP